MTFHGLFFLLKVLFFWKIENSTFNRDSTKFICLDVCFWIQEVCTKLTYIHTYLCTCKYHPLETTYLLVLCMHTNVHCTELKTVFLIETVHKFICLENFQCTVLLIEIKRKFGNSIFNRTVCLIESTEYRLDTRNWDHKFRASVYQAYQAGSELCIEAGKEVLFRARQRSSVPSCT